MICCLNHPWHPQHGWRPRSRGGPGDLGTGRRERRENAGTPTRRTTRERAGDEGWRRGFRFPPAGPSGAGGQRGAGAGLPPLWAHPGAARARRRGGEAGGETREGPAGGGRGAREKPEARETRGGENKRGGGGGVLYRFGIKNG